MSSVFLERQRRRWGRQTLGLRLVLGYTLLFVASALLLAVLAYVLFLHFMRAPDRAFMRTQAIELAGAYGRGGFTALRVELVSGTPDERREELLVRLADPAGRTVLLYNPDNWTAGEVAQLARQPAPQAETWIGLGTAEDEDALEAFALPLADGYVLQVGLDADLRADALRSMRDVFLAIALPVLLLALLGGALLAYRALQPVRQLVDTLHAVIDTGDVETRVPAGGIRGEFADLIYLFNRMLDRIAALVAGLRGTLDSVAHDLRTPMTHLRGRAELALAEERDPAAYREALADTLEAAEAVASTLDAIMELAEAEAGTMPLRLAPVPLSELVEAVAEVYRFAAEARGVGLSVELPAHLAVSVDRSRMRQVVANLLDNAVKYTPAGGQVRVAAREEGRRVVLEVADTGIGIPPDELPRIWDRLYRGTAAQAERGLGLGLSLVRAIVEAHGGRVAATSRVGEGTTFSVYLPAPR